MITASYRKREVPIAQLARRYGLAWGTVKRILHGKAPDGVRRCSSVTQSKRAACARLACMVTKKDARVYPKHPTSTSIAKKLGCSSASVRRHLRSAGFRSFVRKKCVTRAPAVICKRKAFAKVWKRRTADMDLIVFSDEHTVSCNDHGSRTMWSKSKQGVYGRERSRLQNTNRIMIWAAVGKGYKSPVVIVSKNGSQTMDGDMYVRRCLSPLVPRLRATKRILLQDGARPHLKGIEFLKRKGVPMVMNYPPYSPDLNQIEHLWRILNGRISEYKPRTMEELEKALFAGWESITQKEIDQVCAGFLGAVLRAEGGGT